MMHLAFIGLGSNLNGPVRQIKLALSAISHLSGVSSVLAVSSAYRSKPQGAVRDQPDFINAVVAVQTTYTPHELLEKLQDIEMQQGRMRTVCGGPRTVDCDLLLYDAERIHTPSLIVPHPRLQERSFVLVPLHEMASHVSVPQEITLSRKHVDQSDLIRLLDVDLSDPSNQATTAVYPGSFDPITYGHLHIIERACLIFKQVIVCVANNNNKTMWLPLSVRHELTRLSCPQALVLQHKKGLLIEWMRQYGQACIVRGVRTSTDCAMEINRSNIHYQLDDSVDTVLIPARPPHDMISSTLVREIARLGGDITRFAPPAVCAHVRHMSVY